MSSTITALTSGGGLAMAGDTSGQLQLLTNNGTAAVTITTAQNVGIGTTTPAQPLEISSATGGTLGLRYTGNSGYASIGADSNSNILFSIGNPPSEKMRINSSGYLKQSSTGTYTYSANGLNEFNSGANTSVLAANNQTASGTIGGISVVFTAQTPNNSSSYFLECVDSTNTKLKIYSTGTVSNATGTYNTISDVKLKENIVDATPKLDKLLQVKVRNYNLIGDELKQIGFVAQELETIFPALIDNVPDLDADKNLTGEVTKAVKLTVMIPILVKAIQELNAKVDAQALEIQALKGVA